MDKSEFSKSAPGSLVSTTHGVVAFVPDPLPRGLSLNHQTVQYLAEAERAVGQLAGTTAREFNPYLVSSPLLHREAILSSRMEGTITTPEQLVMLEAEKRTPRRSTNGREDAQEVLNYVSAMQEGLELLKKIPVSLRLIRSIHEVLLRGVRGDRQAPGEFRRSQNFVASTRSERIEDARYVPPPVPQMEDALDSLEKYLHDENVPDPFLVRLALVHYQFEAIHPFRDGNGRVGRLLISLMMIGQGRLDAPLLYISGFLERHRQTYVDLLLRVSQEGDWEAWLDFFLRGVAESSREATAQAVALLELRQRYHRQFQEDRSSAKMIRLIDRLFQSPSITINEAAELLDLSAQGAAYNVHKLEDAGVLREATGRKRNQVFVADEILSFLYDTPSVKTDPAVGRTASSEDPAQ